MNGVARLRVTDLDAETRRGLQTRTVIAHDDETAISTAAGWRRHCTDLATCRDAEPTWQGRLFRVQGTLYKRGKALLVLATIEAERFVIARAYAQRAYDITVEVLPRVTTDKTFPRVQVRVVESDLRLLEVRRIRRLEDLARIPAIRWRSFI